MATPGTAWTTWSAGCAPERGKAGLRVLTLRALFGGTFDPVHRGHLEAAREVRDALDIEDFRFLPAGDPPHRERTFAAPEHRVRMLECALADHPGFTIDHSELDRPGRSYMSDTLAQFRERFPDDARALVLGQDALNGLDRWHAWRDLPELAHLVVMTRPGETPNYGPELAEALEGRETDDPRDLRRLPAGRMFTVPVTPRDISSTAIRRCAGDGATLRALVPAAVAGYIERERLYGGGVAGDGAGAADL